MFNLIKMDMHRLVHSASTWVIMAVAAVLAVFCVVVTNTDIHGMESNPESVVTEDSVEWVVGVYFATDPEWVEQIEAGSFISAEMQTGLLALLCIIFAAIFTNAEQKNGFVKNIAGQFPKRGMLIASKFAAVAVQVFVMMLVFSVFTAAAGFALWGSKFYMGSVTASLKLLGVQYLLHLGFAALIIFLCTLFRSSAFSMTAGILLCSGLFAPVYSIINKLVHNIRPVRNFDISRYVLDVNITSIGIDTAPKIMLRGAIVGLAFVAAALLCSMLIIKRRDIR